MFRSRKKRNFFIGLRNWLWPRKGAVRPWLYLRHRIVRLPDTPHRIAAGVASGVAASITPLLGFHFLLAGFIAWAARGNIIASAIGTAIGNPWTFPFIWVITYKLGSKLLGLETHKGAVQGLSWDMLFTHPTGLLGPMLLGALPLALLSWFLTYFVLKRFIAFYRAKRDQAREKRAKARASGAAEIA